MRAPIPVNPLANKAQIVVQGGNLAPITIEKLWGHEVLFGVTSKFALKQMTVKPNEAVSKQVHLQRDEMYLVTEGSGRLELGQDGGIVHELRAGDVAHIPPGVVHKVTASAEGIVIIEASTPELTDAIRLDDRYGRPVNKTFDAVAYKAVLNGYAA